MIISASRRTDIPAFYARWFMNRARAGNCLVANPFNRRQVRRVSLRPEDVEAVVFWTKDATPMEACLDELDAVGLKCVFLFTVNDYPRDIEPGVPPLAQRLAGFRRLADRLGPESVAWRYDPIILGGEFDPDRHVRCFRTIAAGLNGFTSRVVISFLDFYRKTERRMSDVESEGRRFDRKASEHPRAMDLAERLAGEAKNRGMTLQACCEDARFAAAGAAPGACIDAAWITSAVGRTVVEQRDPGQRPDCLCARSVDIGATDTCIHHCRYCYATGSGAAAEKYRSRHDPSAPALRQ